MTLRDALDFALTSLRGNLAKSLLTVLGLGVGVGAVLMLFFNSPGKNPLLNFGLGLWDTYNNLTGILSDVLSYIRLFAI